VKELWKNKQILKNTIKIKRVYQNLHASMNFWNLFGLESPFSELRVIFNDISVALHALEYASNLFYFFSFGPQTLFCTNFFFTYISYNRKRRQLKLENSNQGRDNLKLNAHDKYLRHVNVNGVSQRVGDYQNFLFYSF